MVYRRDPLSVRFDLPARRLVEAAYERKGEWVYGFLPPPGPKARAWMSAQGINPYERDRWGELRFIRSYKRAVFWTVKWYGGLDGLRGTPNAASGGKESHWGAPVRVQWETGTIVRDEDSPHFGAWAVRIRIHGRGGATAAAGRRARDPWIDPVTGRPTFRQSLPDDRDWE
ncbi:MAG TPA: hypothetical protein VME19_04265 [Streptosporangiaceae bacterium]|nr:hypothetical protein [Streptosporangiaceae bacterium]